jgi:iron complex outermembrane receptor protein
VADQIKFILVLTFFSFLSIIEAQTISIQGKIVNKIDKDGVVGVTVVVVSGVDEGTGTTSDSDGYFRLQISNTFPVKLKFERVGYEVHYLSLDEIPNSTLAIRLVPVFLIQESTSASTGLIADVDVYESPIPIDLYDTKELISTGQLTVDEMLHYQVASFNSTQQSISDGTAFFNPVDLRTLGPGRTLVLVNQKRKNPSSLIYINDTPGKGEVGVDFNSIPINAIEKVEILRDGASTQYGSDAIAGVINIQLKEGVQYSNLELLSGITHEGDGLRLGTRFNTGVNLKNNGYLNVYTALTQQNETNRANAPGVDSLFGNLTTDSLQWIAENPDFGMRIGLPNTSTLNLGYDTKFSVNDSLFFYSFGSIMERTSQTYALYRTPYWIPDPDNIFHNPDETYEGFLPTLEGDISDQFFSFGLEGTAKKWDYDLSYTFGKNTLEYLVDNSFNPTLASSSPTTFRPGGYSFASEMVELVTNRTLVRNSIEQAPELNPLGRFSSSSQKQNSSSKGSKEIGYIRFGVQYRKETFISMAGQEESYLGEGAISFPGIRPRDALQRSRFNLGVYSDIIIELGEPLTIGAGLRYEDYSDFDDNVSWKGFLKYKLTGDERLALRTSVSRGFRAPTLHQLYLSNVQTLVSGNTVSDQGTFNQEDPILRTIGAPDLRNEISTNYSLGVVSYRPLSIDTTSFLSVSIDAYLIKITDRVVYSGSVQDNTGGVLSDILQDFGITSLKYFTNGINTTSKGMELNIAYHAKIRRYRDFSLGISGIFSQNQIDDILTSSALIDNADISFFDRKEQSRVVSSRPRTKLTSYIRIDLADRGKTTANLSWNYFGSVTWQHATDADKDQTFSGKNIISASFHQSLSRNASINLTVNNIFNVYPDPIEAKGDPLTNLGGRFLYPWEVNQFGYNGRYYNFSLQINL